MTEKRALVFRRGGFRGESVDGDDFNLRGAAGAIVVADDETAGLGQIFDEDRRLLQRRRRIDQGLVASLGRIVARLGDDANGPPGYAQIDLDNCGAFPSAVRRDCPRCREGPTRSGCRQAQVAVRLLELNRRFVERPAIRRDQPRQRFALLVRGAKEQRTRVEGELH